MKMERVSVAQAAKELSIDRVNVQYLLQKERLPIGYAIKREGKTKWTYYIYRSLLDSFKKNISEGKNVFDVINERKE